MRQEFTRAVLCCCLLLCCVAGPRGAFAQKDEVVRPRGVPPPAAWLRVLEADEKLNAKERAAVSGLRQIAAAEATYNATAGNGSYGTLEQLSAFNLLHGIDLNADGADGYSFSLELKDAERDPQTGAVTRPPDFEAKAAPAGPSRKRRLKSFFIDSSGVVYVTRRPDADPSRRRAVVNEGGSIKENERLAVSVMRVICSAEEAYRATTGQGSYGTLKQLGDVPLIDPLLAEGVRHGYLFRLKVEGPPKDETAEQAGAPAPNFRVFAVPLKYGASGRKSFYADAGCVIRGADKGGIEAGADADAVVQ